MRDHLAELEAALLPWKISSRNTACAFGLELAVEALTGDAARVQGRIGGTETRLGQTEAQLTDLYRNMPGILAEIVGVVIKQMKEKSDPPCRWRGK